MSLDNIKNLMVKAGVSQELSDKICESMLEYRENVVAESRKEVANKIKAAKQVIFEEVEAYKLDLAGKVQLFCESKNRAIEKQLMRKSAAGEAEATQKLGQVYAVLEGIDPKTGLNGELKTELSDAKKTIGRLGKQVKDYSEQAKRATAIAESLINKNRKLIEESRQTSGSVISEGKNVKKTPNLVVPARKVAVAKDNQQIVTESVQPSKVSKVSKTTKINELSQEDFIGAIAAQMG
jgi:hypothetical protein